MPYDDAWPRGFESIRQRVMPAFADMSVRTEHVGSTAVPNLAAKPIIDIDVVVGTDWDVPDAITRLITAGYVRPAP